MSNPIKFQARFWIGAVGARVAKAIGSAINNYAGSLDRAVKYGLIPSIVSAIALMLLCRRVGYGYENLTGTRTTVGDDDDEGDTDEGYSNTMQQHQYATLLDYELELEDKMVVHRDSWMSNSTIELVAMTPSELATTDNVEEEDDTQQQQQQLDNR